MQVVGANAKKQKGLGFRPLAAPRSLPILNCSVMVLLIGRQGEKIGEGALI